jgi:hypothetical protein
MVVGKGSKESRKEKGVKNVAKKSDTGKQKLL